MATSDSATAPARPWLQSLADKTKVAAVVLFVVAAVALGFGIWLFVRDAQATTVPGEGAVLPTAKVLLYPLWVWCGCVAIATAASGIWMMLYDPQRDRSLDMLRLFVLTLGGVVGFLTLVLGVALGYQWWNDILVLTQSGGPDANVTGSDRTWTIFRAIVPLPVLIIGMAIMFVSLLLARTDQHTSPFLRRLLYGYNAAVQCILVLLIIAVANVYVAMKFAKPLDFTGTTFYTLSSQSEKILHQLQKPAKVYVILSPNVRQHAFLLNLVKPMLANCQAVSDKLEVEYISLNRNDDPIKIKELQEKYKDLDAGLLLVYGNEKDKPEHKLIKASDLVAPDPESRTGDTFLFKGEDVLISELDFLANGRTQSVIYFTQGNGELDLKDSEFAESLGGGMARLREGDKGLGVLKERLEKRHIDVKPLQVKATDPKVPPDASLVVVPGPRSTLPDFVVKALDDYMARKGKLLVLLDPIVKGGSLQPTGLEGFLARYNVQLPAEIVYTARPKSRDPREVRARLNPELRNNPLAVFADEEIVLFDARPVRPVSAAGPPGASPFRAEALLVADPRFVPWAEPNVGTPFSQLFAEMQDNPALQRKKLEPGQQQLIPMAVAVSESTMPNPHMGMRAPPPPGSETLRLIVIGDSTLASNRYAAEVSGNADFDFLAGVIDWMRGKTNSIGIAPKKPGLFAMKTDLGFWPFVLLPSLVICLGVIGTGTSVWLVRRR